MTYQRRIQPATHDLFLEALTTMPLADEGRAYESGSVIFAADGLYPPSPDSTPEERAAHRAECKRRGIMPGLNLPLTYFLEGTYLPHPNSKFGIHYRREPSDELPLELDQGLTDLIEGGRVNTIGVSIPAIAPDNEEHKSIVFHKVLLPQLVSKGYQIVRGQLSLTHKSGTGPESFHQTGCIKMNLDALIVDLEDGMRLDIREQYEFWALRLADKYHKA